MPRLFVAVWPPDDVLDRVAALDRPEVAGLRWTGRGQWHVTLRFLGQVADAGAVATALSGLGADAAVARLGPAVDRFGQRILHVPVTGLDAIALAAVEATGGMGQPPDDRPFSGHLTLARAAKHAKVDLRPLVGAMIGAQWRVDSVCLVESRLSPHGPHYDVLDRFRLSAGLGD